MLLRANAFLEYHICLPIIAIVACHIKSPLGLSMLTLQSYDGNRYSDASGYNNTCASGETSSRYVPFGCSPSMLHSCCMYAMIGMCVNMNVAVMLVHYNCCMLPLDI